MLFSPDTRGRSLSHSDSILQANFFDQFHEARLGAEAIPAAVDLERQETGTPFLVGQLQLPNGLVGFAQSGMDRRLGISRDITGVRQTLQLPEECACFVGPSQPTADIAKGCDCAWIVVNGSYFFQFCRSLLKT